MAVNERVQELVSRIEQLEQELQAELLQTEKHVLYEISNRKVRFEEQVRAVHRRLRVGVLRFLRESRPQNVLSAPMIYAMIVPLLFLDLWVSLYQRLCFPLYGIPRVPRERYIAVDRHQLAYLNGIERVNCAFCGYANGLIAYVREIAARTEQYWCPIKHARKLLGTHARYRAFLPYGDPADYAAHLERMRGRLAREDGA